MSKCLSISSRKGVKDVVENNWNFRGVIGSYVAF